MSITKVTSKTVEADAKYPIDVETVDGQHNYEFIGASPNMVFNGGFRYGKDIFWTFYDPDSIINSSYPQMWINDATWTLRDRDYMKSALGSLLVVKATKAYAVGESFQVISDFIPVTTSTYYTAHFLAAAHRMFDSGGEPRGYLHWYNGAKTYLSTENFTVDNDGSSIQISGASAAPAGPDPSDYDHMIVTAQSPSNAEYAKIVVIGAGYDSGETDAYLFIDQVFMTPGRSVTPYVVRSDNEAIKSVGAPLGNGDSVIASGKKVRVRIPEEWGKCRIIRCSVFADASGSVNLDIKKASWGASPSFSTICGTDYPSLSSAQTLEKESFTGWTLDLTGGDLLSFESTNEATTITYLTIQLDVIVYDESVS
jgi:hypothetical protein